MPKRILSDRLTPPRLLPLFLLSAACANPSGPADETFATWITEAEYEFGDAPEQEVLFTVPFLRADPYRNRILVRDRGDKQISAWTPDGSLLFVVGGSGDGPGEFTSPSRIYFAPDGGFSVRDDHGIRFTRYTADGGLVETVLAQDGTVEYDGLMLTLEAPADNGYLGFPLTWADVELGTWDDPVEQIPVLHATRSESGQWLAPEQLFRLDIGGRIRDTRFPDDSGVIGGQPFTDADQVRFVPGSAVAMRLRDMPPGRTNEVEDATDTHVWGVRRDEMDLPRVTGRRLVPTGA